MEPLLQDLRYAVRQLIRTPGFTVVAVITLALGIGANTAVFSLANWVLLRPLSGVRDGGDLVAVGFRTRGFSPISYPAVRDLAAGVPAFESFAGEMAPALWQVPVSVNGQSPRLWDLSWISGDYFGALGVVPHLGRTLGAGEETLGGPAAVVVSHAFWRDALQSDPAAVGKVIKVLRGDVTIAGVTPEGFRGTDRLGRADFWMLASSINSITGDPPGSEGLFLGRRGTPFWTVFGRLAPDATIVQAETQVRALVQRLAETYPQSDGRFKDAEVVLHRGLGVAIGAVERVESAVGLLLGVTAAVLLIAAANFANLLLFRGIRGRAETGVRMALGAPFARLVRQGVLEGLVLAGAGCGVALLLAVWIVGLFRGAALAGLDSIDTVRMDWRVVAFSVLSAVILGVGGGLVAPVSLKGNALSAVLKEAGRKASARWAYFRSGMVVVQLAASLMLLVGAGLLVSTLQNLRALDLGFDADRVHVFSLTNGRAGYSGERDPALVSGVRERIARLPGVENVSVAFAAPFGRAMFMNSAKANSRQASATPVSLMTTWVSPGYFATLGIRLVRGREFTEEEFRGGRNPADVAVISESLSQELFGERDPVGQYLTSRRGGPSGLVDHPYQVVGVAADAKWLDIAAGELGGAMLYHTLGEGPTGAGQAPGVTILVRSSLPASRIRAPVEAAIAQVAPSIPITETTSLGERVERTIAEQKLFAQTVASLTILAVLLAGVGLYSLVGFAVAERNREFGIRIALGAQVEQVLNLVVRDAARLGVAGVALGTLGAVALSRLISSRLFGVTPLESYVYVGAVALLVLVILIASMIPARSATRVDPIVALRSE